MCFIIIRGMGRPTTNTQHEDGWTARVNRVRNTDELLMARAMLFSTHYYLPRPWALLLHTHLPR